MSWGENMEEGKNVGEETNPEEELVSKRGVV